MAGVSQILANPRFGIVAGFEPLTFWSMVVGMNLVMYLIGSWWIFGRLLKRDLA